MEFRVLRYFLVVAQEESITRASEVLHITQPTLSRQLAQLEEEYGVQLFLRGKRKITLTEEGMLLRRRAEEILELVEITEKELSEQDDLIDGKILIGSGELSASKIFPKLFKEFGKKYPKVKYDLYTGNADQIKERIDKGLLDIGLLLEPVNIEKYDFIRLDILERWGVLMGPDDPLTSKAYVTVDDLKSLPLIMVNRSMVQNEISNWFGDSFENLNIVASHNMSSNAAKLVEYGIGYAIVIEGSVSIYSEDKICYRPLFPELKNTSVLAWKKNQMFTPTVARFLQFVKTYLEK